MAVNPTLLHPSVYQEYGLDIRNVATLPEDEIININKKINEELLMKTNKLQTPFKRRKFATGFISIVIIALVLAVGTAVSIFMLMK